MADSNAIPERGQGSGTKSYARWNPEDTRAFIVACDTAIFEGLRNCWCFTKHGWKRVSTLFNSLTGHNWKKQQLRNHWDTMRRTWRRFSELLNCSGIEYNPSTGCIVASEEWWSRKLKVTFLTPAFTYVQTLLHICLAVTALRFSIPSSQENKEYKDFKDKDISEIYIKYRQLFGDSFDGDKYAMTLTKLCRTGFGLFEDSALEDHRDSIPVDVESSGSSDEAEEVAGSSGLQASGSSRGGKRKSSSGPRRGKKKKLTARELSFSVDRATSATEEVAARMNTMMTANDNSCAECVEELLAIGRLERNTPLYFFTCTIFAQKGYRDMLRVMKDADEKMNWLLWYYSEHDKKI